MKGSLSRYWHCQILAGLLSLGAVTAQLNPDYFPYLGLTLDGQMSIVNVSPGSPADRAGLASGDRVVNIEGRAVGELDHSRSVRLLRGELGAPVSMTVSRGAELRQITLIHEAARTQKAEPAESQLSHSPLAVQLSNLDKQLVVVAGKTELTEQVLSSVARGLALLPESTKKRFLSFGVSIVLTPTLEQLLGVDGHSEYDTRNKRVIICEQNTDGSKVVIARLQIITLHELGHAYDQMLGYPSKGAEFRQVYDSEAPLVPAQDRAILSHFLQPGMKGPSECFASLFACRYYHGNDRRLVALKADFPKCFALMQQRYSGAE